MNEKLLNQAKSLSVSSNRLDNNIECYPVNWLLEPREVCWGYKTKLEMLMDIILEMDKNHTNYQNALEEDKDKIELLIQNPDVVKMVIVSIFQWFGTNVGKSDIGRLMDEIRELKYERFDVKSKQLNTTNTI